MLFSKSKNKTVCAEAGVDYIKIGSAQQGLTGREVTRLSVKKSVSSKEDFKGAFKAAFKELNITGGDLITYVPRHLATIRTLDLPSADRDEIADMVELQITAQTPYSKEEVITDFKILGPAKEGHTKVMLVLVRKSIIDEQIKLFRDMGFEVRSIGLSSEMAFKLFRQTVKNKPTHEKDATLGFIDIDSNFTDFLFIYNNNLVFTRGIFIGIDNLLADPEIWKDKFIAQIKNSIEVYQLQGLGQGVNEIIVTRVAAKIEGFLEFLKEGLNAPVKVLNLFENAAISEDALRTVEPYLDTISLSASAGSLLSGDEPEINLLPQQLQLRNKFEQRSKDVVLCGLLLVSILMTVSGILIERIYNKISLVRLLKQEVLKTNDDAGRVEKIRSKIDLIKWCLDEKYSSLNCLYQLYNVTPDEIYFTSIVHNFGEQTVLTGVSSDISSVFEFVTTLERLDFFEKIKTNYTTKKKRGDMEMVDFELTCSITK
jgi:Tfp pilus assembly PilM family ATPase